jgi:hypothetical protein
MPISPEMLSRSWARACAHAEVESPAEARLYYLPGEPINHQGALHLHPGSLAVPDDEFPFTRGQLDDANRQEHRDLHRVAIRDVPDEATTLGLLRHELEHARQYRFDPAVYEFMEIAVILVGRAFGDAEPETLRGSGVLYNALAHETDANRAAAACVRAYDVEPTAASSPWYDHLFRDEQDPDLASLAPRLVAACALFPRYTDPALGAIRDFDAKLEALGRGLAEWWSTVRPAAGLDSYAREAISAIPTPAQVEAGEAPGDAWRPAEERVDAGVADAIATVAASQ